MDRQVAVAVAPPEHVGVGFDDRLNDTQRFAEEHRFNNGFVIEAVIIIIIIIIIIVIVLHDRDNLDFVAGRWKRG
jgi:uncharacterized integral membrane protein